MQARITFQGKGASVVRGSLAPEAGREIPRSQVRVVGDGDTVELLIDAEDVSALRAALNSYLRWVQVALDVHGTVTA